MKVLNKQIIEKQFEASFPDIDIDVDGEARGKIMDYFHEKYGREHAAFIGNKNYYSLKSAVQDVSSAFDIPSREMFAVTKFLNDSLTIAENCERNEKVKQFFDKYEEVGDIAEKLVGVLRNMSIHAGGVVLTDKKYPIKRFCPLQRTSDNGALATLFDKGEIESFGFVKYDILGLNTARQIQDVRKILKMPLYEDTEPYEDEVFKDIVLTGKNKNIFQFETDLGKRALLDLSPMNIRDIAIASSIIRLLDQGKAGMEVYNEYKERCRRKLEDGNDDYWRSCVRDEIDDDSNYEILCDILKESLGVLVYQEQLCFFVSRLSHGKLTFSDGNKLRKILGKFRDKYGKLEECEGSEEKLKNWHKGMMEALDKYILPYAGKDGRGSKRKDIKDFIEGKLVKNAEGRLTLAVPEKGLLAWIISGSVYIFSKLHAIAYSKMGYVQMWQKYHHPREFWYAAIINRDKKKLNDILATIKNEKADIEILPPTVNDSNVSFLLEGKKAIRFGLSYITGMNKAAEYIINERNKNGRFKNIIDFIDRCPKVNKKQIQNLLYSNSFCEFGDIKKVYETISRHKKNIDECSDFSDNALSKKEYEALSCNITFMSDFLAKALDYLSYHDMPDNVPTDLCVRIEKKTLKKTNAGKDYFLLRVSDYNSGETFSVFEWNTAFGEKMTEGESTVLRIKKSGDFHTVVREMPKKEFWRTAKKFLNR